MIKQTTVSGIQVSYDTWKTSAHSKTTLVLLHGWGGTKESWKNNIRALSKHFDCISLDLPGFGGSQAPNKPWGTLEYADFVRKFVTQLKIKSPVIVGKSFGGRIAIAFASKWPKEIQDLILVSSAGIEVKATRLRLKILTFKLLGMATSMIPYLDMDAARKKVYQFLGLKVEGAYKREVKKLVTNQDLRWMLNSIEAKTLIVWGDKDEVLPISIGERLSAGIEHSKLEIIEGGDHWVHETHAEEFNQLVINFLK